MKTVSHIDNVDVGFFMPDVNRRLEIEWVCRLHHIRKGKQKDLVLFAFTFAVWRTAGYLSE